MGFLGQLRLDRESLSIKRAKCIWQFWDWADLLDVDQVGNKETLSPVITTLFTEHQERSSLPQVRTNLVSYLIWY